MAVEQIQPTQDNLALAETARNAWLRDRNGSIVYNSLALLTIAAGFLIKDGMTIMTGAGLFATQGFLFKVESTYPPHRKFKKGFKAWSEAHPGMTEPLP